MSPSPISVGEALSFAWRTFKSRPWIFIQLELLLIAIALAFSIVTGALEAGAKMAEVGMPIIGALLLMASLVITILSIYVNVVVNNMGVIRFYLTAQERVESVRLADVWAPHPFWKFVGTTLLIFFIVLAGLLLLIIPGIIFSIMFFAAPYLVMDRNLSPVEALKESARITKGHRLKIFLLGLALIGINILGALALLVGLFITIPLSLLAAVHVYRALSGRAHGGETN